MRIVPSSTREALLEREGKKKPGEQLDARLRHSEFLQQARPIAVQPLRFRLVAIRIPALLGFRMLDVHNAHSGSVSPSDGPIDGFSLRRSAAA